MKHLSILQSRVARRIVVAVLLCALVPIGSLVGLTFFSAYTRLNKDIARRLHHASKNVGMAMYAELGALEVSLRQIATSQPSRQEAFELPPTPTFVGDEAIEAIWILPVGNLTTATVGPRCSKATQERLQEGLPQLHVLPAAEGGADIWIWTVTDNVTGDRVAVAGRINSRFLWQHALGFLSPDAELSIVDTSFRPLFRQGKVFPIEATDTVPKDVVGHHAILVKDADTTWLVGDWGLFLRASFNAPSWYVLVGEPRDTAFATLLRFFRYAGLTTVLAFGVVLLASSILIRRTLQPLQQLTDATLAIGQGRYDTPIQVASSDEFGDLAQAFTLMSQRIQQQTQQREQLSHGIRRMLGAIDQGEIIHVLLECLSRLVQADVAAVLVRAPYGSGAARCWFSASEDRHGIQQDTQVEFIGSEWECIAGTGEAYCQTTGDEYPGLLAPLVERGAQACTLFPVDVSGTMRGLLAFGYDAHQPAPEDAFHGRQLADQLGVALSHAHLVEELDSLNLGILTALARTVDANSRWNHGHSERVTRYALAIAQEMGVDDALLVDLQRAGLLHDLGKVSIPAEILNKPGKLNAEEYVFMKQHPVEAARILEPIKAFDSVRPIVAQHHERWDGQGYPEGLQEEEIHLGARILAVADVYDALYSDRPYRECWPQEEVFHFMRKEAGGYFDPNVVQALFAAMQKVESIPADWARASAMERIR